MDAEKRIVEDIKQYGWHIINVLAESDSIQFSYTIGLFRSFGAPELFLSGLKGEISATVLDDIALAIKGGRELQVRKLYNEFFEGYDCYFDLVEKSTYDSHFGKAVWFYGGKEFPVVQCVWPNEDRLFPWETKTRFNQEILFKVDREF